MSMLRVSPLKVLVLSLSAAALVSACQKPAVSEAAPAQMASAPARNGDLTVIRDFDYATGRLCIVHNLTDTYKCAVGDTLQFMPPKWGNAQLPLLIAAQCNLAKNVVYNDSGLVCEYQPKVNLDGTIALVMAGTYTPANATALEAQDLYALQLERSEALFERLGALENAERVSAPAHFADPGILYFYVERAPDSARLLKTGEPVALKVRALSPFSGVAYSTEEVNVRLDDSYPYAALLSSLKVGDTVRLYAVPTPDSGLKVDDRLKGLTQCLEITVLKAGEGVVIEEDKRAVSAADETLNSQGDESSSVSGEVSPEPAPSESAGEESASPSEAKAH